MLKRAFQMLTDRGEFCGIISDRHVLKATYPFLDTAAETLRDIESLTHCSRQKNGAETFDRFSAPLMFM